MSFGNALVPFMYKVSLLRCNKKTTTVNSYDQFERADTVRITRTNSSPSTREKFPILPDAMTLIIDEAISSINISINISFAFTRELTTVATFKNPILVPMTLCRNTAV